MGVFSDHQRSVFIPVIVDIGTGYTEYTTFGLLGLFSEKACLFLSRGHATLLLAVTVSRSVILLNFEQFSHYFISVAHILGITLPRF